MISNHFVFGILAEVDAGKTTLSEQLLFQNGEIRRAGCVDEGTTHLDTNPLETERGITVFSSQACLHTGSKVFTLIDTPGHADFAAETFRVLSVLDFCVLVISASNGVRSLTFSLWKTLERLRIPVIIFINKTDLYSGSLEKLTDRVNDTLGGRLVPAEKLLDEDTAMLDDILLERILNGGQLDWKDIQDLFHQRKVFPVICGSAIRREGTGKLLELIDAINPPKSYPDEFGAKVFKVSRDKGDRLVHAKITGGTLQVKDRIDQGQVEQIRVYSGRKWENISKATPGMCVQLIGPDAHAGDGLGFEKDSSAGKMLKQVYRVSIEPEKAGDSHLLLEKLKMLEEEMPELEISMCRNEKSIEISLAGSLQTEILKTILQDRFQLNVRFSQPAILYQETVLEAVEGIGHYEPLRHYAEVHLKLEPAESGSGIHVISELSEDELPLNYQNQVLSALREYPCHGVLAGKELTDINISLIAGKHHIKHTEGGDFREAARRALRQGLMKAKCRILEPWMYFEMILPKNALGRAMNDIEALLHGQFEPPVELGELYLISGQAPAAFISGYPEKLKEYTKGLGSLSLSFHEYRPCINENEVIEQSGYFPDKDTLEPSGSVFCDHGAGVYIDWCHVEEWMHIPLKIK